MSVSPLLRSDQLELNPLFVLRWEDAQQAHILLYPEGMVRLNPTAGQILTLNQSFAVIGDLIDHLTAQYDDPSLADDVINFLTVCVEKNWLRHAPVTA